jgi:hypothetical protein
MASIARVSMVGTEPASPPEEGEAILLRHSVQGLLILKVLYRIGPDNNSTIVMTLIPSEKNLAAVATEGDVEYQANEAYESMSIARQFSVFLLFAISAGFLIISLFLLPGQVLIQSRPFDSEGDISDLVLQLLYEERKAYQPFVSLSIEYAASKGRSLTLSLKYRIEVLKGLTQVSQTDVPTKPAKLVPGSSVSLLSFEDIEATKFVVTGNVGLVEGSFKNLVFVWRHFNATFALFVIFIDCILSFVLLMTALSLSFRIASLAHRIPTLASKYQVVTLLIMAVMMLPVPELVYLDLFYWIRSYTWLFQVLYRSLFLILFDTLCWNLKYREDEEEKWLYRRSIVIFSFIFAVLAVPDILTLNDKKLEQSLKQYAPIVGIGLLALNALRLPLEVGFESEEFRGAVLHLAIVLPGIVTSAASLYTKATRFDKLEIYSRMLLTLSFIFLAFIRWPFEGIALPPQDIGGDDGIGVDVEDIE